VTALTDASEAVQTRYKYESFGKTEMTLDDGHGAANPFRYTGRELDETGDYYYRARYYDPGVGRFVSEDSIGFVGGVNFYSYVRNAPVNYVDPLGLWEWQGEATYINVGYEGAGGGYLSVTLRTYKGIYNYEAQYKIKLAGLSIGLPGFSNFSFELNDFYYGDEPDPLRMEGLCGLFSASVVYRSLGFGSGVLIMGNGLANITGRQKGMDIGIDLFGGKGTLIKVIKINSLDGTIETLYQRK
jgi:RHS repeat-associated protein